MAKSTFLIFFLLGIFTTGITSGDRSNARSTAMAFTTAVSSFGNDAFGINPANYDYGGYDIPIGKKLKLSNNKPNVKKNMKWEFSTFSMGGGYGSDSSIEFYNNYLSYLSIDRNSFVNLFTNLAEVFNFRTNILPGDKTDVNYDFELNWLSVNYRDPKLGAINVSVSDRVGLNTNVNSRDDYLPLDFVYTAYGNKYDLTNVRLYQSEAIAWWIRKYNIGYAKQFNFKNKHGIRSLSFGIAGGLVHGFGNVTTYDSRISINTWGIQNINGVNHADSIKGKQDFHTRSALTDFFRDYKDGAETQFNLFPKPAGIGYSVDIGISMQVSDEWRFAASVTDLGSITWNYNTIRNDDTDSIAYYNFFITGTDPTYNAMVDDLGGYNTQDTINSFTSEMPTKYRVGLMFQPSGKFMVEFDWSRGKNNLPGNSDENIFSAGAEYFPLPYLPVRTGISMGGPGDFYISLGAGVKFKNFSFDIGTHGVNQLIMDRRFSVAISSKVMF